MVKEWIETLRRGWYPFLNLVALGIDVKSYGITYIRPESNKRQIEF